MITKIIIFGSNGMLGTYLQSYFTKNKKYELICLTRADIDIQDNFAISNLDNLMQKYQVNSNTCIINCIGLIPQRNYNLAANKLSVKHTYYLINTVFPNILATLCMKYEAKYIHPSTDCVFNGSKNIGEYYTELDKPDEINDYGTSKYLGEPSYGSVIRVSIIGEELQNKKSFLEWIKNSKEEINCWNNHYWNGITCLEYARILDQIINRNLFWNGVKHLYPPNIINKYDLAKLISEIYNLDIIIRETKDDITINKCLYSEDKQFVDDLQILPLRQQIENLARYELKIN